MRIDICWNGGRDKWERNDCGVRALAVAGQMSYPEAHKLLKNAGRRRSCGTWEYTMKSALRSGGFKLHNVAHSGTLARFLKNKGMHGRYLVWVTNHFTTVIDGRIWDSNPNPSFYEKRQLKAAWEIK